MMSQPHPAILSVGMRPASSAVENQRLTNEAGLAPTMVRNGGERQQNRLLPAAFHRGRIEAIRAKAEAAGLAGVLLLDAANVYYASGYLPIPSERPIGLFIGVNAAPALYLPLLEQENVATARVDEVGIADVRAYFEYPGETHPIQWMLDDLAGRVQGAVGIDALDIGVHARLQTHLALQPTPVVEPLRWIKTPEEIALIERAAGYADFCLETLLNLLPDALRDGASELDLLAACLNPTRAKLKAEVGETFLLGGSAVVGTVHSGAQAALPHGSPNARQPQPGDTLIAGIGVSVGGYHAESGATFILGQPVGDSLRCLEAAAACDRATVAALRPGVTCASVNEAALSVLREYGYNTFIRHRIGHGMGINGHESPWLAPGDTTIVQPGMVFSCEPGIYRPGVDGYRTINTLIVTEDGTRVPNRFLADHPPEKRVVGEKQDLVLRT